MEFNTKDCAWSNVRMNCLGKTFNGLREFSLKKSIEKEHVYASGDEPVDIQTGNKKYEGSLKLLKYEVDLMNDAALIAGFADILEVPHTLITITVEFKKLATDKTRIISVVGVAFTELDITMAQNAKMTEVSLPLLAMRILHIAKAAAV